MTKDCFFLCTLQKSVCLKSSCMFLIILNVMLALWCIDLFIMTAQPYHNQLKRWPSYCVKGPLQWLKDIDLRKRKLYYGKFHQLKQANWGNEIENRTDIPCPPPCYPVCVVTLQILSLTHFPLENHSDHSPFCVNVFVLI